MSQDPTASDDRIDLATGTEDSPPPSNTTGGGLTGDPADAAADPAQDSASPPPSKTQGG